MGFLSSFATGLFEHARAMCLSHSVEEGGHDEKGIGQGAPEKLSAEIAGLESLDLNQLRVRWKLLYEIEAPPHLSRDVAQAGSCVPHPGECARWPPSRPPAD